MLQCDSKNISVNQSLPCAIATTAYARMYMFEIIYKLIDLGINIYYMDTDSMTIDGVLPNEYIGNKLGLFKLEHIIKKAYFLGIKKYGYIDNNDKIHSTFSGIERNSLSWNEIEQIANGFTVVKETPIRFFKIFNTLNIIIKNSLKTSITFKTRKILYNNFYKPININIKFLIIFSYYLKIIKYRIISLINKYKIFKLK